MGKPSVSQDPLIGTVVGGRYEIMRLIGKGGMGSIYEVRNTRLGRSFALKILTGDGAHDPELLARFRREADVIARIKHPNIVEVIDWETLADGSPAMVMEYLHGEDLGKRINASALPWPQLARIADQVLAALSIAHANGIVHRDLKPQNIFLAQDDSGDETVKLLDFGVSKVRDSKSLVTTDSRLLGTPAYMAPEQADGRADEVGTHTDVWSIGAIVQEMATGELAFDGPSLPSILYRVCHGEPKPIATIRPDAPAAFVALVHETLARDIDKRISDATVLRVRLREALRAVAGVQFIDTLPGIRGSEPIIRPSGAVSTNRSKRTTDALSDTVGATPVTVRPVKRRRWLAPAVGGALVAGALVVFALARGTRGETATPPAPKPIASVAVVTPPPPPAPDPMIARMKDVLEKFVAWAKGHKGAPCPDLAALGVTATDLALTCTDQPGDQIVGVVADSGIASWQLGHELTDLVRGTRWPPAAPAKRPAAKKPPKRPGAPGPKAGDGVQLDENGIPISR